MVKKYFFLIFFLIFGSTQVLGNQNKETLKEKGCSYKVTPNYLKNIDDLKIKLIEIDIHEYKKWTVNGVRILTNRFRYVPDKYKRRFESSITISYDDGSKCFFEGRIRHSGDEKDHIARVENSLSQSLDVHLKEGNIKGFTKFKLLRSNTRGNLEDEILVTEVLRNLNYLAPRTYKVKARVNQITSTMILQEKAAKEMLEFNKRRESSILEADERFFFQSVSKIEDNHLSGWEMGVVPIMNQSSKYMLSKQVNSNILEKSEGHKKMSLNSVNKLNLIYLYFSNRFQDGLNNFNYFDYDLDNTLLANFNEHNISKLDEYNLFMQATNSSHGLAANNRKFYWNSLEDYFEPINYDSNADINKNIPINSFRYPLSKNFYNSFDSLQKKLSELNYQKIIKNLGLSGIIFTEKELNKKIKKISTNLDILKQNYISYTTEEMIKHNEFKEVKNLLENFHKNLNENYPQTYLIKNNFDISNFQKCEIFLENCLDINLSPLELSSLLEGDLSENDSFIQYLGSDFNFNRNFDYNKYKKINFKNINIFYEDGISLIFDEENNSINIKQELIGAKIFFINGELYDTKINFEGFNLKNSDQKIPSKSFPTNETGLTGCLSLINTSVKNLSINVSNSTCEDAVNFINSSGVLNTVFINDSISDALDVDFSDLKFKEIKIKSAKNDCVDVSYGNYKIEKLYSEKCGDKALSVGEKSDLYLNEISSNNSKVGIASKDSSTVNIKNSNFYSVETCLSAYKKKQEFEGGIINFKNMSCKFLNKKINFDKFSLIRKVEII